MTGNTPDQHPSPATTTNSEALGPEQSANSRPVSPLWIAIGCFALLLGLAMGFVMSSLGR